MELKECLEVFLAKRREEEGPDLESTNRNDDA